MPNVRADRTIASSSDKVSGQPMPLIAGPVEVWCYLSAKPRNDPALRHIEVIEHRLVRGIEPPEAMFEKPFADKLGIVLAAQPYQHRDQPAIGEEQATVLVGASGVHRNILTRDFHFNA